MVVITHYQRLLDHIVPDVVHVLSRGRIVKTGGKDLALELEAKGYAEFQDEADEELCALTPDPFYAVGLWYGDFTHTTDKEVRDLLEQAAAEHATVGHEA